MSTLTIPNTNADQSSQLMKQEILKKTLITAGKYIYIQFNHADLRREKRETCIYISTGKTNVSTPTCCEILFVYMLLCLKWDEPDMNMDAST